MKILKRWREVPEKSEFKVAATPDRRTVAVEAADVLTIHDRRPDRLKGNHPGVESLEGDSWTVHAHNGTVYLSGENGLVQVQFAPVDAFSLGTLLHQAATE